MEDDDPVFELDGDLEDKAGHMFDSFDTYSYSIVRSISALALLMTMITMN